MLARVHAQEIIPPSPCVPLTWKDQMWKPFSIWWTLVTEVAM